MLDGLSEFCTGALAEHGCPSVSVAVADRGEVVHAAAYGTADLATGRPATPDTVYGLASITKPMTATAVCHAADEGLLDLDAPCRSRAPTAIRLPPHANCSSTGADWARTTTGTTATASGYPTRTATPCPTARRAPLRLRQPRLPPPRPAAGTGHRPGTGRLRPRTGLRAARAHRLRPRAAVPGPGTVGAAVYARRPCLPRLRLQPPGRHPRLGPGR